MLIVCGVFLCGLHSVQSINDDLNASLATADELSKEFNSLLKGVSSDNDNTYPAVSQVLTRIQYELVLMLLLLMSLLFP